MPTPRPAGLREAAIAGPVRGPARQQVAQQPRPAALPSVAPDNRGLFEKLFNVQPQAQPGPALAYATPGDSLFDRARRWMSGPSVSTEPLTAIYDISARTVYMPDGTTLEAHSGLGDRLDDPRHVNEPMRGATPPHVYDLEPRAQLFHGVQALRLNPAGGGGVFGRTGLLAHTYMLGPRGDSNGCVSFKNYNAFLQAYLNGQVKRLVVVAQRS